MDTSMIFAALVFVAFALVTTVIGILITLRFARINRQLSDHVVRFYRDEDVSDAADMATDDDWEH